MQGVLPKVPPIQNISIIVITYGLFPKSYYFVFLRGLSALTVSGKVITNPAANNAQIPKLITGILLLYVSRPITSGAKILPILDAIENRPIEKLLMDAPKFSAENI